MIVIKYEKIEKKEQRKKTKKEKQTMAGVPAGREEKTAFIDKGVQKCSDGR